MVWHGTVRYKSIWLERKLEEVIKKLQLSFVFLFQKGSFCTTVVSKHTFLICGVNLESIVTFLLGALHGFTWLPRFFGPENQLRNCHRKNPWEIGLER